MRGRLVIGLLLVGALVVHAPRVDAQDADQAKPAAPSPELKAFLDLPITPGSIAVLVEYGNDAAAQQRLRDALKDSRPDVRGVAARVIYGGGMRMLLPDLRAALKAEQHSGAGSEELRTLMTLAPSLTPECVAAAVRLESVAATEAVETLARLGSPDLITHLPALQSAHANNGTIKAALRGLMDADATARDRLLHDLATDPTAVEAALTSFLKVQVQPADEVLIGLVKSDQPTVRIVAEWQIDHGIVTKVWKATPALAAAMEERRTATAEASDWDAFAVELFARLTRQPAHKRRWPDLAKPGTFRPLWDYGPDQVSVVSLLSNDEQHDLAEALHMTSDQWNKSQEMAQRPPRIAMPSTPDDFVIRTVPGFVAGFWTDVLQVTHCAADRNQGTYANVGYRPDGRPRKITVAPGAFVTDACSRAARVLFSLTLPHLVKPIPETYTEALILSLEPDRVACADEGGYSSAEVAHVSGLTPFERVEAPKRVKMVNPVYPLEAQQAHLQGVVFIESTISRTGCVLGGTVLKSPDPRLSSSALNAVLQWRYTPSLIDGKPVPVQMTVTVNFSLEPR